MERETGIEPATNSLEGCDSTTELLPPPRTAHSVRRFGGQARHVPRLGASAGKPANLPLSSASYCFNFPWLANRSSEAARAADERRLVAREGFEPSKPLGRQIYSLLRLTASLPRRVVASPLGLGVSCRHRLRRSGCCRGCAFRDHQKPGELAKGFEPPTG